ncbi:MAG: DAK2 domain-containing protein [Clostridia bacterium]|nr:DAK2 domain-containing protein [Clostridia bacterium]
MSKTGITNVEYKNMVLNAASTLTKNKDYIDSLNVFPVPDGDTGTNMNLTMQSVVREIEASDDDYASISNAMAVGSLKGARGNSGVILSQILKGFSSQTADVDEINAEVLKNAFKKSEELAYKAVMKPKEGTILTVCRAMSNAAAAQTTEDVVEFFENVVAKGNEMLKKTPDMLPILKEAGVVDSGGTGLVTVMTGMLNYLKGENVDIDISASVGSQPAKSEGKKIPKLEYDFSDEHIHSKYSYCTEFLINGVQGDHNQELRGKLEKIGDCVLVVGDSDILKVHVHTDNPGNALQHALELGYLNDIKIENMDEQRKKTKKKPSSPRKSLAMIAVSAGDGIDQVFKQLNVDVIIKGGQSMNPSVEDFMAAVDSIRSENIIILPNNKNIVMACDQVAKESKKNVKVVATHSIPQGINAAMVFNPETSIDENIEGMKEAIEEVHSIQITKAVRTTTVNDLQISQGDFIAILDGDIKAKGYYINDAVIACMSDKELGIEDQSITLFYGEGVTEDDADKLAEIIEDKYPDVEVDVAYGGQPLYPYIISVE